MPLRQVFRQKYVQEERKEHKREENVTRESVGKAKLRRWEKVPVLENDTVPAPVVLNSMASSLPQVFCQSTSLLSLSEEWNL